MSKKLLLSFLLLSAFILAQSFNEGPYGTGYYDTAGPFFVADLNSHISGDINSDELVNVQDIIIVVGAIIGITELTPDQEFEADLNDDEILDILDIVQLVNLVLYAFPAGWDFQTEWNGDECYIFIQYDPAVPSSSALWNSDTQLQLLNNSPLNVHYFFISNRLQSNSDVNGKKNDFDDLLADMTEDLANHWRQHLHFIPVRTSQLDNWLAESLSGVYGLAIDRFQRIRQIGYLGNPNGFVGTHMSYLAHEAIYYNWEHETFSPPEEEYFEVTVFDSVIYNGGWGSIISANADIPTDEFLSTVTKLEVDAFMPCIGYDDDNCDDYDRISSLRACAADSSNCMEIARWITPFDRQPHYLTDITPFLAALRPGGTKHFRFNISGWPNSIITLKFRFYTGTPESGTPREIIPLWIGDPQFNDSYNDQHEPLIFDIPEEATRVEFVAFITGHGMGCDTGNCAEFCNSGHIFEVNGGNNDGIFQKTHPEAGLLADCMDLEQIAAGVLPNQWGTWGYGRAGWCPGWDVPPYIHDITPYIFPGDQNIITYEGCFIDYEWQGCTDWPLPIECGGGYQAEIILSSFVIVYY